MRAVRLAMFKVIADGIPDSEMLGHWLTPHELWQVVAFVRTLGRIAPQKINGDPIRGRPQTRLAP